MNVLLVDDDRYVIAALQKGIDWEGIGIGGVFTAGNISTAKEIMLENRIDLLISDIDMPHGSGLDLLSYIRDTGNKVPAIFLTNYADFGYAKRALELRSFNYFLKPIDYEELTAVIKDALKESAPVSSEEELAVSDLWRDYLIESRLTDSAFLSDMERTDHSFDKNSSYYVTMFHGKDKSEFVSASGDSDLLKESISGIVKVYEAALGPAFLGRTIPLFYDAEDFLLFVLIPAESDKSDAPGISTTISEIAAILKKQYASPVRIFLTGKKKIHELSEEVSKLSALSSKPLEKDGNVVYMDESEITQLLQYVEDHFREEISREQLSEMFYFDPDYITKIFKKETGMSFKNYVIEKRLSLAKDLLRNTDYSVSDISMRVGYDNYSYFTRLFKKSYGLTPVDYRNNPESSETN